MSNRDQIPTTQDLQGQIEALKQVLLFTLDALADSDIDLIDALRNRIPTGSVPDFVIAGDQSGPARQSALNAFSADLMKIRVGRSRS